MPHSEVYSGRVLASGAPGGIVILVNPYAWLGLMASSGFCERRGGSCACLGMISSGSFDWGPCRDVIHKPIEGLPMPI
jgi:hypothetical protein